jgi:Lrp/AsnC family leucine-responsive transcriptional regulator
MHILDEIDYKILHLLQEDAQTTNKEIAAKLGLTTTPVHERIKRMERDGVIQKYTAIIDRRKLDKNLIVFVNVSLKEHAKEFLEKFENEVQLLNEVVECYCISGDSDFLLKIIVKDMDEYRNFILNKLAALSNIGNAQSHFVVTEVKHASII